MKRKFKSILLFVALIFLMLSTNCKKEAKLPNVSTISISNITESTATCNGDLIDDGGSPIISCGVCWNVSTNPTIANSRTYNVKVLGKYSGIINGLQSNTTYYVRAYATNAVGTAYGQEILFATNVAVPKLGTIDISSISSSSAISGGRIINDGGAPISETGVCWNTAGTPTISDNRTNDDISSVNFVSSIKGLEGYQTYYVRAYATNSSGTGYGNQIKFTTPSVLTVTDYDGNVYNTVTIGTQVWLAENLRTIHYRNGDRINYLSANNDSIANIKIGIYQWYNDNINNRNVYGALYNWHAIKDSRNLCPTGWHIPSKMEWTTLITFLGGTNVAGGKMKEGGSSRFNALLAGGGRFGGSGSGATINYYTDIESCARFHSSSLDNVSAPLSIILSKEANWAIENNYFFDSMTLSVRCLKD
jgi:uncharacterized protein (TIGR02145 family)